MLQSLPVIQSRAASADEPRIAEVAFKGSRREYYGYDDGALEPGDWVMVRVDRGRDVGRVRSVGAVAVKKCGSCNEGASDGSGERVLRRAHPREIEVLGELREDEEDVRKRTREIVRRHGLKMKVTEAEWQWDRDKLLIYFTADRRVDFRQLVRELARTFRARIQLKQIGVRDEAALLGGIGRCGRELCCATWLREPKQVSLQLARDQNLSLNPQQISGTCGRLLCCLTYEHDAYLQARKRFPREGRIIRTSRGEEKVVGLDIWRERVTLLNGNRERRQVSLEQLKAETTERKLGRPSRPEPIRGVD